jgi:hypothetical protein
MGLLGPNYGNSLRNSFGVDMGGTATIYFIDVYGNLHSNVTYPLTWVSGSNQVRVLTSMTNGSFVEAQTFTDPTIVVDSWPYYYAFRLTLSTPIQCRWVKIVAPTGYGLYANSGYGGYPYNPTEIMINGNATQSTSLNVSQPIGDIIRFRNEIHNPSVESVSQLIKNMSLRRNASNVPGD